MGGGTKNLGKIDLSFVAIPLYKEEVEFRDPPNLEGRDLVIPPPD